MKEIKLGQLVKIKSDDKNIVIRDNIIGNKITIRNNTKDNIAGFSHIVITETMIEDIKNCQYKLIESVNLVFDYFIENGFSKAEKFGNKIIMYYDKYEELKKKILSSIISCDFSEFEDDEIMAMAKAIDFYQQNNKKYIVLDIGNDDIITIDCLYTYLQFNMDYKIKDGIKLNEDRNLP